MVSSWRTVVGSLGAPVGGHRRRRLGVGGGPVGQLDRPGQVGAGLGADHDLGLQVDVTVVEGGLHLVGVTEHPSLALGPVDGQGQVVDAEDHVLGGHGDGPAGGRREDVVGRQHQHPGLGLGLSRQGQVDGHLVAVEVGVEGGAHQGVDLDGLALDQHRLEGLDAQAVEGGGPVEKDRMLLDHPFEHVPHLGTAALDHPFGRLDVLGVLGVHQPLHHERLEQLEGHQLGQTALVELQGGSDHDDRTARVVDPLAQQVLTEPALLALQHVRQALERTVARPGHRPAAPTVVEEGVDRLLQHALLVVDDDLGGAEVEQPLQPVVPVDHPPVEVVEVGGGEPATVELHHGAQVGGDDRDRVEDHGPGVVDPPPVLVAPVEGGHDLEALDDLLATLGGQGLAPVGGVDHLAQLDLLGVEVDPVDEPRDGLGPHAALEVVLVADAQLAPEHLVLEDLARVEALELVEGPLGQLDLAVVALAGAGDLLLDVALAGLDLGVLGPRLLELGQLALERLEPAVDVDVPLLLDVGDLDAQLGLQVGQVLVALGLVDPGDQVGGEVDDLLQLLGLELLAGLGAHEQIGQPAAGAPQVPDVDHRGGQLDVAHALAPDLGPGDLDAAALADDPPEPDPLVLPAVALPVLGGTEDLLAEEAVLLGPQGAVVDGLRLLHLTVGPPPDGVGGGQTDAQLIEIVDVQHLEAPFGGAAGIFLVRAPLGSADVDAEFFGCAEDVLVQLPHLYLFSPRRQDLDVEAQ